MDRSSQNGQLSMIIFKRNSILIIDDFEKCCNYFVFKLSKDIIAINLEDYEDCGLSDFQNNYLRELKRNYGI